MRGLSRLRHALPAAVAIGATLKVTSALAACAGGPCLPSVLAPSFANGRSVSEPETRIAPRPDQAARDAAEEASARRRVARARERRLAAERMAAAEAGRKKEAAASKDAGAADAKPSGGGGLSYAKSEDRVARDDAAPASPREDQARLTLVRRSPALPEVTVAADEAESDLLRAMADKVPGIDVRIVPASADPRGVDMVVDTRSDRPPTAGNDVRVFTEVLAVVAAKDVSGVGQLAGKQVSFGPEGSASQAVGRRAFASMGIRVVEVPLDLDNALDGVALGDVAAVVTLAPSPSTRLAKVDGASGAHLLPFPEPASAPKGMAVVTVPAADYPGLAKEATRTFSVPATLRATGQGDAAAKALVSGIRRDAEALRHDGYDLLRADADGTPAVTGAR